MPHLTETQIQELYKLTFSEDASERADAVRDLCPCHIKRHVPEVWERMIVLAEDPSREVRNQIFHVLGDGSPREYEARIVAAYEKMQQDPDERIRRKARKLMAQYRNSGKINVL